MEANRDNRTAGTGTSRLDNDIPSTTVRYWFKRRKLHNELGHVTRKTHAFSRLLGRARAQGAEKRFENRKKKNQRK
jgi:hypothetical protein